VYVEKLARLHRQILRKTVTETQGNAYEMEPDSTNGNGG
jgi:hypothetical protein